MRRLACILAAATIAASPAAAYPGAEGEPAFGISGYFQSPPRLNQPTSLLIRVWGEDTYDLPVTSVARISIPDGIEVVSGDTVSVARVPKRARKRRAERVFRLVIRPTRYGSYLIRGWLGIDAGEERGADETDFFLPLEIQPDTVLYARAPRVTRYENVRRGQRYRYGGRYLVPIDSTQALLEEEITLKAKASVQEAAHCPDCPAPLPIVVPFVVMVGSDGRVRETRFLDIQEVGTIDPLAVTAAAEALARWQFEPARAKDRPVADYLVVRVPVRDGTP
jgi:hypothetical protein